MNDEDKPCVVIIWDCINCKSQSYHFLIDISGTPDEIMDQIAGHLSEEWGMKDVDTFRNWGELKDVTTTDESVMLTHRTKEGHLGIVMVHRADYMWTRAGKNAILQGVKP